MVTGDVAARWRNREELRAAMGGARPVCRADMYCSDSLRIRRVATMTAGTYFIVTESDQLFAEDYLAMQRLDGELRAAWRKRVVETDYWGHPHKWFPLSSSFQVHVVHPEFRPEWEAHDRQAYTRCEHGSLRKSA